MSIIADDNNDDMDVREMRCNLRHRRCGADPIRNVAGSLSSAIPLSKLQSSRSSNIGKGHLVALKSLSKSGADPKQLMPRTRLQCLSVASMRPNSLVFTCEAVHACR